MKPARRHLVELPSAPEHLYVYPPRDGVTLDCSKHPGLHPILLIGFPMLTLARLQQRGELFVKEMG